VQTIVNYYNFFNKNWHWIKLKYNFTEKSLELLHIYFKLFYVEWNNPKNLPHAINKQCSQGYLVFLDVLTMFSYKLISGARNNFFQIDKCFTKSRRYDNLILLYLVIFYFILFTIPDWIGFKVNFFNLSEHIILNYQNVLILILIYIKFIKFIISLLFHFSL
jgi:hypothetical protein